MYAASEPERLIPAPRSDMWPQTMRELTESVDSVTFIAGVYALKMPTDSAHLYLRSKGVEAWNGQFSAKNGDQKKSKIPMP